MLCLDLDSDLRSNVHLSIITPAMASCARYHCSITPRFCVSLGVLSSEDLPRPLCVGYRRIYSTIAPTLFVSTTSAEAFLSSSDAPLYSFPQKVRVLEIPLQSPKARPAFQRTTVLCILLRTPQPSVSSESESTHLCFHSIRASGFIQLPSRSFPELSVLLICRDVCWLVVSSPTFFLC